MINDKIAGLDFEMRQDGVYLKVERTSKHIPSNTEIESAFREKDIINADVGKIMDIISRKRGIFEFAGPPFKVYNKDKDKYISIKGDPMAITCTIFKSSIDAGFEYFYEDIQHKLEEKKIVFGIDPDAIKECLKIENIEEEKEIIVAKGRAPIAGLDASIEELIAIDSTMKPQLAKGGRVDFREVDNLHTIKEKTVIAIKHPPTLGTPGMNVFGIPIAAKEGMDKKFLSGPNTEIIEDGRKLIASVTGFLYRSTLGISIGDTFMVKDNLDFNVGNIKYKGDVVIAKDVLPGFRVEADGDIVIGGGIEAADIHSRFGSVKISGGIFGKDKCSITAKKDIEIEYAQHAELSAEGTLIINGYTINCQLLGGAGILHKNTTSKLVGGSATTYGQMNLNEVGNDKKIKASLFVKDPDQEKFKEKSTKLANAIREIKENIQKSEVALKNYNKMIQQLGPKNISPKIASQLKITVAEYQQHKNKLAFMERELEKVKKLTSNRETYSGKIIIRGKGWPDIEMDICYYHKKITSQINNKQFQLKESAIQETVPIINQEETKKKE